MLVAAAICPPTPLLVPEIAGGAAEDLSDVRDASIEAVGLLRAADLDLLVTIAPGDEPGLRETRFGGTFRRFGVNLGVGGEVCAEPCTGLLVGRWLVDGCRSDDALSLEGWEIGADTGPGECARIGRELAERSGRVGLLVMGDGSACRTLKAPGYLDERAVPFDDAVSRALGAADTAALAAIDPTAASALLVAGRAPWQVLAGAAEAGGVPWRARLLAYSAPFGVGYFSAFWEPHD